MAKNANRQRWKGKRFTAPYKKWPCGHRRNPARKRRGRRNPAAKAV